MGVEPAPAHQVIKKLKMDNLWVYTLFHAATGTECDKKKTKTKKGMLVTEILITCTR